MPADPPPVKIVGQSSFVDFGENSVFCGLKDRKWALKPAIYC